jgi:hypothetical protein
MRVFPTQKEDNKRSYIRAAVAVSQTQHICLLKERDRPFFRIFKNLNSYYNVWSIKNSAFKNSQGIGQNVNVSVGILGYCDAYIS